MTTKIVVAIIDTGTGPNLIRYDFLQQAAEPIINKITAPWRERDQFLSFFRQVEERMGRNDGYGVERTQRVVSHLRLQSLRQICCNLFDIFVVLR